MLEHTQLHHIYSLINTFQVLGFGEEGHSCVFRELGQKPKLIHQFTHTLVESLFESVFREKLSFELCYVSLVRITWVLGLGSYN